MRKAIIAALTLTAALSFAPAAFAATTSMSYSARSYEPLYTESSWMTLRVPLGELGGRLPSDLSLNASGLPSGTSVTLTGKSVVGDEAVLTVSVQRSDVTTFVNANSLIALSSGGKVLTSFNVPVIGSAYASSF